jgi:hypothetical protein
VSPPLESAPPKPRQTADKVSGDYSHQYETISESNSWDFEVPIPPANLDVAGEGFTVTCSVTPTFYKNKFFCANRSAYKNAYQIIVLVKNFPKINLV